MKPLCDVSVCMSHAKACRSSTDTGMFAVQEITGVQRFIPYVVQQVVDCLHTMKLVYDAETRAGDVLWTLDNETCSRYLTIECYALRWFRGGC